MNETKFAKANTETRDTREGAQQPGAEEIRLLDDYELVLAGGGEADLNWP